MKAVTPVKFIVLSPGSPVCLFIFAFPIGSIEKTQGRKGTEKQGGIKIVSLLYVLAGYSTFLSKNNVKKYRAGFLYNTHAHTHMHAHAHTHMHAHMHTHTHTCTCMHTLAHTHAHACTCTRAHTHMRMRTHAVYSLFLAVSQMKSAVRRLLAGGNERQALPARSEKFLRAPKSESF